MSRILRVPEHARSAHAVFTSEPVDGSVDFPPPVGPLLKRFGATEEALARLDARPHARVFLTEAPTPAGRSAARRTRDEAAAFAEAHDGVLVDLTVPRIVDDPAAIGAAAWVAVNVDPIGLTTHGLEAFGLPELRLDGVEPEDTAAGIAVLVGLSERLLTEWPQHDPVGPASVTLHDIALAYDDQIDETGPERATELLIALRDGELVVTLLGNPVADLFG